MSEKCQSDNVVCMQFSVVKKIKEENKTKKRQTQREDQVSICPAGEIASTITVNQDVCLGMPIRERHKSRVFRIRKPRTLSYSYYPARSIIAEVLSTKKEKLH